LKVNKILDNARYKIKDLNIHLGNHLIKVNKDVRFDKMTDSKMIKSSSNNYKTIDQLVFRYFSNGSFKKTFKPFITRNNNKNNKDVVLMLWVKDLLLWESIFQNLEFSLGFYPSIELIDRYLSDDSISIYARINLGKYAKEILVKKSLKLIISIARRYTNSGLTFEDLIAEGILGLMKGIAKFDFSKGHKFSTYAHWWVRQSISRSIDDQSRIIRLPVYVKETLSKIKKLRNKFLNKYNRYPNISELSVISKIPEDRLQKLIISSTDLISLDNFSDNESNESTYLNDSVEVIICRIGSFAN